METKFKYSFDESTGILYKYYFGSIDIEDIYSSWDYAIENNIIPKNVKGFLLDYTNAMFDVNIKEYKRIPEYYKNHLDIFRNHRIAILTQSPKDVVIPTLVESKDEGYSSRPFFTLEAALGWILGN